MEENGAQSASINHHPTSHQVEGKPAIYDITSTCGKSSILCYYDSYLLNKVKLDG